MPNPFAHDPDCDFWHDHYESECTCSRPGWKPPRAVRHEIAELRRRIEVLEARVAAAAQRTGLDGGKHATQPWHARRKTG